MKVSRLYGEAPRSNTYYVVDGVDWNYLNEIIYAYPAMKVEITRESDTHGTDFYALLEEVWETKDGQKVPVYDAGYPKEETHGHYSHEPYDWAKLIFSKEPISCTVTIEGLGTTKQIELAEKDFSFALPPEEAFYRIYAMFEDGDRIIEAVFSFELGEA